MDFELFFVFVAFLIIIKFFVKKLCKIGEDIDILCVVMVKGMVVLDEDLCLFLWWLIYNGCGLGLGLGWWDIWFLYVLVWWKWGL